MLEAIHSAQRTIRLETYIYAPDAIGDRFREALIQARKRGVKVQVLIDALGSYGLPSNYWEPLKAVGGEALWFNPLRLGRLGFRSHRKLLVCDEEVAFVGGFNIAKEYEGDGVKNGWCDLGLQLTSPIAVDLAASFDEMFARADLPHKRFMRLRRSSIKKDIIAREGELLLSGPARGRNPFKRSLRTDLVHARNVQIIAAYFLPTWRIRLDLMRVARRGGKVQLILAGKSDVALSQLACRSLYRRLLKAGIEIYEYQPQILHAKLVLIDNAVYVGSSNLDPRSLNINYELMLRFQSKELAAEARDQFKRNLQYCEKIELEAWRKSRTWWNRLQQRWAYFILARLDPFIVRWQYQRMPN
ncbi:MAG: Phospholipase D/Transphosphatidylase [Pedosphaera sp.]|nr:Phospholipase D/Transphosphatidylase [Pedosphaera sp.]